MAEILWQRGYTSLQTAHAFLDPAAYVPAPYYDLPDIAIAIARLQKAIAQRELIRIWGDFDVDGQTSTSLLLLGLRELGALVDYTIPNRATQNHGLNADGLRQAIADGVRVLLTCDCAVTDFDEVALARELGLDVIISDHHDLANDDLGNPRLPAANAILNPKRLPPTHPLASLPGVGVAYKLMEGLAANQPSSINPTSLLDLVALGIICDVAEQQSDTRYLLQCGLAKLRSNPRLGIRQLLQASGLNAEQLDAEGIGYQIGPRLNSAGRLDTASLSVDLLTATDAIVAKILATRIEELNQERKILQRKMDDEALVLLTQQPNLRNENIIVLAMTGWPPSVLGVVASSISQRFQKPTILISVPVLVAEDDGQKVLARGSARSFGDIDIHAAIASQADLIESSGGHPMAAGFSIRPENINAFRKQICAYVARNPPKSHAKRQTSIYDIAWKDVSLALCNDLERLAPFGAGNPRPVLRSNNIIVARAEPLGSDGKHQALFLKDETGHMARALWWRSTGQNLPNADTPCNIVFTLQHNWYRNKVSLTITLQELRRQNDEALLTTDLALIDESIPVVAAEVPETVSAGRISTHFRILDYRFAENPAQMWQALMTEYGEANIARFGDFSGLNALNDHRDDAHLKADLLMPRPVLAVATAPAGPDELRALLAQTTPQVIALFAQQGTNDQDQHDVLVRAIKGMVKVAEKRGDHLEDTTVIERMAWRVRHRPATIVAGIAEILGDQKTPSATLNFLLEETRAYRHYFYTAPATAVLAKNGTPSF